MQLNGAKIRDYYRLGSDINSEDAAAIVFRVPHFQRPYKWSRSEIQSLIKDHAENEDSSENNSPYFAGAVVTSVENSFHSLIDGQQRYTTLFLANYVRFLLYRSYFAVAIDRKDYKAREHATYFENVANYVFSDQEFVSSEWLKDCIDNVMDDHSKCSEIRDKYLQKLFLPNISIDNEKYIENHYTLLANKLTGVNFLLSYDRKSFNDQLRESLSRVAVPHSSETGPDLVVHGLEGVDSGVSIYIDAIQTLFESFYDRARKISDEKKWNKSAPFRIVETISAVDKFMRDLRFCVVQTGKKEDAYTLFEVLNDRALSLDDLDIVKNYFYKQYVIWSQNNPEDAEPNTVIDKTLEDLDELWGDKVFGGKPEYHKRLVSYLAVVYLSGAKNLSSDRGVALREAVKKYLSSRGKYTSVELKDDFKVFSNVDSFIDAYGLRGKLKEKSVIESVCHVDCSYIKKFFLMTHALDMSGVMPGVMNPLLKVASNWPDKYLQENINKTLTIEGAKALVPKVEELAFNLFKNILASCDYKTPRELVSGKIINQISAKTNASVESLSMGDFRVSEDELDSFDNWTTSWQYSSTALRIRIRILLIILLGAEIIEGNLEIKNSFITVPTDTASLTLDHLEPSSPNWKASNSFFDDDERHQVVNSIGNMMLLDASSNTSKSNYPMEMCFEVLNKSGLENHWMTKDITFLLENDHNVVDGKKVPTKEFFSKRGARLRKLMTCILRQKYGEKSVKIPS